MLTWIRSPAKADRSFPVQEPPEHIGIGTTTPRSPTVPRCHLGPSYRTGRRCVARPAGAGIPSFAPQCRAAQL